MEDDSAAVVDDLEAVGGVGDADFQTRMVFKKRKEEKQNDGVCAIDTNDKENVPVTSPPTKKQRHQETDGQDTKCPTSTEIEALSILALTTSNMKHHKAMMRPK